MTLAAATTVTVTIAGYSNGSGGNGWTSTSISACPTITELYLCLHAYAYFCPGFFLHQFCSTFYLPISSTRADQPRVREQ